MLNLRFLLPLALLTQLLPAAQAVDDEDETPAITASVAPYIYDAYAAKPRGIAKIADRVSQDFRSAPDEFAQWDYLQKLTPVIQRKIKEAKETPVYKLLIGSDLDRYDFDQMAFPSGLVESSIISLKGSAYSVIFANITDFKFIPIPIEQARKHQLALRQSRSVTLHLLVKPVQLVDKDSDDHIKVRIVEFQIQLPSGEVIAEKKL